MRTLPGCELQVTSNTALREWDNQQSAFQALLSWACGGRVNTVLSPYDAASGDSWWPVTTALSPRDTCDVWVTCWVHVLTGDHRCPRKSVLLRRNSNTCNVRLHLYVEQFVRCQLASFPECEGAAAFPGFRVVRLRVNMVIVWGEEREMRDERREERAVRPARRAERRGENYCSRGWLLLQNTDPSLLVLIITRFTSNVLIFCGSEIWT